MRRLVDVVMCAAVLILALPAVVKAGPVVSTSFDTSDGFVTGSSSDVTLSDGPFQVTFSGGQQQQGFDFNSYNSNPAAYMVINGTFTGGFGGTASGASDTATIDFNLGVTEVSFFAANRANGAGTTIRVLGLDDSTVLATEFITQTSIQPSTSPTLTSFSSSSLGALIGSIQIDNAGPAGAPPYVTAIDTFRAKAVPEPSTLALLGIEKPRCRRRGPLA